MLTSTNHQPLRTITGILAGLLALAALHPTRAATTTPFNLDVLLPLTGPQADAGRLEAQSVRVYETVVNKAGGIHGQPVHFDIHDDQGSPVVAVQIVNELLQAHPVAVLGPSFASTCAATSPLFVNGPVDFCFSPLLAPPRGGYVFAAATPIRNIVYSIFAHARALGFKNIAILATSDASGLQQVEFTKEALADPVNRGLKLVALETYAPDATSVSAQVAKIKAAQPDFIGVWATGAAFGTAIREFYNAGLNVPVYASPSGASEAQLAASQSFLPATLLTAGLPYQGKLRDRGLSAAANEYLNGMKEAGIKTESMQAYAWDPIKLVVTALQRLPAGASPAQLRDYLVNLHGFAGVFGMYDFRSGDQHGVNGLDLPFLQWDNSRKTWTYYERLK